MVRQHLEHRFWKFAEEGNRDVARIIAASWIASTDKKQLVFWLITVAVPIAVLLIPESQTYTHAIKVFFAITIGMILIVAFETLPILIPSLLLPVCYGLAGLAPMGAILAVVQFDALAFYRGHDHSQCF